MLCIYILFYAIYILYSLYIYIILYYIILCYIMLYYVILFYIHSLQPELLGQQHIFAPVSGGPVEEEGKGGCGIGANEKSPGQEHLVPPVIR